MEYSPVNSYKHQWLIFLFLALVSGTSATQSQQFKLPLDEVPQTASLIFVGTIEETESRFNDRRTMIFTDVYFKDLFRSVAIDQVTDWRK
jgi:hypothetical protein